MTLFKHPLAMVVEGFVAGTALFAMTITPTDLTNWLIAFTGLVTALGIIYANVVAARTARIAKVIEHNVNSAASKAQAMIEGQVTQLAKQQEVITKLEQQAALLAQSAAIVAARPRMTDTPGKIDQHTAEIAENTAEISDNTKK